jgi:hypothetical protein
MTTDTSFSMHVYRDATAPQLAENVDVEVVLQNQTRWAATVFTPDGIERLLMRYAETGECLDGRYVWAKNMIIARDLSDETLEDVVADLIASGEFRQAFEQLD